MKKKMWLSITGLLLVSMILAACGPAPTPTAPAEPTQPSPTEEPTAAPEPVNLVIGYTASLTGKQETPSGRQVHGFDLWMQDVNNAGGITLSDGTVVTFTSVSYDDESDNDRVQELYTRLATEDNADLLISPYSSGLTAAASIIAEQYGKVMITTGAASDSNYTQGYTQVFQIYTPASRYLTGAVDLLQTVDSSLTKVAFVYENDKFSTDVVTAAKAYAESLGYEIVLFEGYDTGTTDFGSFINKIVDNGAEAILGGGHFEDGTTFARQLFEKNTDVKFITLLVAPPEPDFADLGDAALGIVGPSQWEPQVAFTEESAATAGLTWFGPANEDFIAGYTAAYNEEPSYHSAGGYAAGLALQYAIQTADSVDPAAIKAALDSMDILTFYGHLKFDTTAEAHGLQIGHSMVYIQWQLDESGGLGKQVVWPLEGATAETLYPLP